MGRIVVFLPVVACLLIIFSHLAMIVVLRKARHLPDRLLDGSVVTAYSIFCCYYVQHIYIG